MSANHFTKKLLRKWAAGKPISKHQLTELINDGYLAIDPYHSTVLTRQGIDLLAQRNQ